MADKSQFSPIQAAMQFVGGPLDGDIIMVSVNAPGVSITQPSGFKAIYEIGEDRRFHFVGISPIRDKAAK